MGAEARPAASWHLSCASRGRDLVDEPHASSRWSDSAKFLTVPAEDHVAVLLELPIALVLASFEVGLAHVRAIHPCLCVHIQVMSARRLGIYPRQFLVLSTLGTCF